MEYILGKLKPVKVFKYFEEISNISRVSGNCKEIADYLVQFAIEHNYTYDMDNFCNVTIFKDSTNGSDTSVILQSHIDMVGNSDEITDFKDFVPKLKFDKEYIWAQNSTLGADNGIGVSMMLAILDDKKLKHPKLECVFTADEEIGLIGASIYDASRLDLTTSNKKYLINLDSEEEGVFTIGCAGGVDFKAYIDVERMEYDGDLLLIKVKGLKGGHSGIDIYKQRSNAISTLGLILLELNSKIETRLVSINGGIAKNVIPNEAQCTVVTRNKDKAISIINHITQLYREKFLSIEEKDMEVEIMVMDIKNLGILPKPLNHISNFRVNRFIASAPVGIYSYFNEDANIKDTDKIVESSLNLGVAITEDDVVSFDFGIRSATADKKAEIVDTLKSNAETIEARVSISGDYPAWDAKSDSQLLEIAMNLYHQMFKDKQEPEIEITHAGLECGVFVNKICGLEAISFGPTIIGAHTTAEKVNIKSVKDTYEYLIKLLEIV